MKSDDAISRQAAIDALTKTSGIRGDALKALYDLPPVSTEKTDDYKQGWHDAIGKALNEAYDVVIDGERFSVVQEETLIGLGTAYEQVSTEKTGRWIFVDKAKEHAHCSECDYGNVDLFDGRPHNYCQNCGARNEVEE